MVNCPVILRYHTYLLIVLSEYVGAFSDLIVVKPKILLSLRQSLILIFSPFSFGWVGDLVSEREIVRVNQASILFTPVLTAFSPPMLFSKQRVLFFFV